MELPRYTPTERPIQVCSSCGCAVGDPAAHNRWHAEQFEKVEAVEVRIQEAGRTLAAA